jgi:hypothetical protein
MAVSLSALLASRTLPPGRILVLICVRDSIYPRTTVRSEGLDKLKTNPMTSSGMEPATSRGVAYSLCLNQIRYHVSFSK